MDEDIINQEELDDSSEKQKDTSFVSTLIVGGAIGSILGFLFAPKKGEDLRHDIKDKAQNIISNLPYSNNPLTEEQNMHNYNKQVDDKVYNNFTKGIRNKINKSSKGLLLKMISWLEKEGEK